MEAEILTIGDEILIGQIVDTNSAWMGQQLSLAGIRVHQITSVSDDPQHIVEALRLAESRAQIILITGGLGPTKDDLTKKTLRDYFGMGWRMDNRILEDVTGFFARFGRELTEVNRLQAQVPDGSTAIRNSCGTAPGMWFERNGKVFVSMPGVPHEMKAMMEFSILPMLKEKFALPFIYHKTILTQGLGESMLAERIEKWEDEITANGWKLAYLPSPALVRLRISASGDDKEKLIAAVEEKVKDLQQLIPQYIFGYGDETIESVVAKLLSSKKKTLSLAESCTGGYIAHLITSVPGSSEFFMGGTVAYSNEVKMQQLDVPAGMLAQFGAVSKETAEAMATGARAKFHTDYAIAVTGIAGPGGGSPEKPVGTVWIAIAAPQGCWSQKFLFGDNRERNIIRTGITALNMLRRVVLGEKAVPEEFSFKA